MDVALVASLVSPIVEREANGPHRVIADLARGLTRRGHRTTVYAAAGSAIDGVRVHETAVPAEVAAGAWRAGRDAPEVPAARDAFRRLSDSVRRGRHDVVLQHAFDAAAIEADLPAPILHVLHLPPIVPAVVFAAQRTAAPLAAVSRSAAREWEANAVQITHVLPNGVPDPGPSLDPPAHAALIAGRISPEKGTAIGIRVALAAELEPWIVGDAYDADYFQTEVRPYLDDARYVGPIPRSELAALMGAAAVAIMPIGWSEPFGLIAAEAQMAGCPVVAYRRGALPEVVEHGVSGLLVPPGDEAALVTATQRARGLDRLAIRASARRRLGLEAMLDRYEMAMASLVQQPTAGGPCVSPSAPASAAVGEVPEAEVADGAGIG